MRECTRCGAEVGPRRRVCDDCKATPAKRPSTRKQAAKKPAKRAARKPRSTTPPAAPEPEKLDRVTALKELVESLRPVVTTSHSEHGLQGLSGLVGQYRAALEELEKLQAERAPKKGTVLDELKQRRASKSAAGAGRPARRQQRR